jgi:hypothetical protein
MRRSIVLSALAALVPAAASSAAVVDFHIASQEVTVDRSAGVAQFALTFTRAPVFVAAGGDAFQYEIDVDSTDTGASLGLNEIDAVARGGEIWEGQGIPLREVSGAAQGPEAGGWGPVRALFPFDLDENTIIFKAPLAVLGANKGTFRYRALAIENGATSSEIIGAVIPTPAALGPGIALLSGVMVLRATRRRLV